MTTEAPEITQAQFEALMKTAKEVSEAARYLAQMQEPGWSELGSGSFDSQIAQQIDRNEINRSARWYYHNDPIPNHAIALHNAYTFGRGVSFKAVDPAVHTWLETFWNNPRNQHSISRAAAQWQLNRDRHLDGELFLIFYTSTLTGHVTVRTLDASEIRQVVTMPGDRTFPVYFQREFQPEYFDFASGKYKRGQRQREYLPDWRNAGPHGNYVNWPANTEIHVMHVLTNPLAGRGLSHMATGLPWIKAFKGFMEDRVTLTMALALFAFKQKIKGNRQAAARIAAQWGNYETIQRYGIGDGRERRQGGGTLIENDAASLEQLKTDSGASNAYQDGRMLKQQAGIGTGGIFEHYFGDPSTGNLATATAMELPMLKLFEFEQQLWEDVFKDIFQFVLIQGLRYSGNGLRGKANIGTDLSGGSPVWVVEPLNADLDINVTLPPIVQSDIAVRAAAMASIASAEAMAGQMILPPREKALEALRMFGFDDAGDIVDRMEKAGFKFEKPEQPADPVDAIGDAVGEAIKRRLREAQADKDTPPHVGAPLPKKDGEKVDKITRGEVNDYFDAFADMPELDDLLKQLGLTLDDVDEARRRKGDRDAGPAD